MYIVDVDITSSFFIILILLKTLISDRINI